MSITIYTNMAIFWWRVRRKCSFLLGNDTAVEGYSKLIEKGPENTGYPYVNFEESINVLKRSSLKLGELQELIGGLGSITPSWFHHRVKGGLEMQQIPGELSSCAQYLVDRFQGKTVNYLEVGVGSCGTLIFISELFAKHNITVSYFAADNFAYHAQGDLPDQKKRVEWCRSNIGLKFHDGDTSQDDFRCFLDGKEFDIILIDGDHSFDGCMSDVLICSPHLKQDGVLLLHDITSRACPGVVKVFQMLKSCFTGSAVFSESDTCGIGILEAPIVAPPSLLTLMQAAKEQHHIEVQKLRSEYDRERERWSRIERSWVWRLSGPLRRLERLLRRK